MKAKDLSAELARIEMEELNKLQKKNQELQKQELLKAIEASPRSYDEIIKFLDGKSDSDEE